MNQDIFMKINDYVELKRCSESDAAIYWQRKKKLIGRNKK